MSLPSPNAPPPLSTSPISALIIKQESIDRPIKQEPDQIHGDQDENQPQPQSDLLSSISALEHLSSALSNFTRLFKDLETHMKSIHNFILEKSLEIDPIPAQNGGEAADNEADAKSDGPPARQPESEIERICSGMNWKGLRKYISARMGGDAPKVREEVAAALEFAPEPARLTLDCFGRFYSQGGKAFVADSAMCVARDLGILILEAYIVSRLGGVEQSVREEAQRAAAGWRSRLVNDGGVGSAGREDALGLLLLVSAFGVPQEIGPGDLADLIRLSDFRGKAEELLPFMPMITEKLDDVVEGMSSNGMHVSAVYLACAWGLEEKFDTKSRLSVFLTEINQAAKKLRREGQGNRKMLKEACEMLLTAFKSVNKCLQDNKLNYSDLVSTWKIKEKIANLKKELHHFAPKSYEIAVPVSKRKAKELGPSERGKTQSKRFQSAKVKAFPHPPFVPPQGQGFYDAIARSTYNGGGLMNSQTGLPGVGQSNGGSRGLLWAANPLGSVPPTNGVPAAGARPLTPIGAGSQTGITSGPYVGYGSGLSAMNVGPLTNSGMGAAERDGVYDNSSGQKVLLGVPPSAGQGVLRRPQTAVESFPGLPHSGAGTSNIFQFVDTVLQIESERRDFDASNTALPRAHPPYHPAHPAYQPPQYLSNKLKSLLE